MQPDPKESLEYESRNRPRHPLPSRLSVVLAGWQLALAYVLLAPLWFFVMLGAFIGAYAGPNPVPSDAQIIPVLAFLPLAVGFFPFVIWLLRCIGRATK